MVIRIYILLTFLFQWLLMLAAIFYMPNKDLQFEFNSLNLLDNVKQNGAVKASYTWAADGVKISAVSGNDGFEYLGSMVFSKTYSGIEPESVAFPEGRFMATSGAFTPVFHHRNHLGSVCAESVIGHEMPLKTANDYMPYGTRFSADGYGEISQYTFSGKERQTLGSLGLLDFGARMYDPTTCRWLTNDPLAERYYNVSPYVYAGANPIRYIDPDGRKLVDTKGNLMWNNGKWTKYAPARIQHVGNVLRSTPTGKKQFDIMANHDAPVTINFAGKNNDKAKYGQISSSIGKDQKGKATITSSDITLYDGEAKDNARIFGINEHQAMAATLGHEAEHMTDDNAQLQYNEAVAVREGKPIKETSENKPNEIKAQIAREFREQNKPIKPKFKIGKIKLPDEKNK